MPLAHGTVNDAVRTPDSMENKVDDNILKNARPPLVFKRLHRALRAFEFYHFYTAMVVFAIG
jgi:hypothetical protein